MDQDKFSLLKSHVEAYTRKDGSVVQAHDDKRVAAAPKAPPLATHAAALAASSKPGDMDHTDNQIAAGYMKEGDHKSLAGHLKNLDTAARDHILDHVHPDHRGGLGFKQLSMDRSKQQYADKFESLGPHKVGDTVSYQGERGTRTGKVTGAVNGKVKVEHKSGYYETKHHSELSAAGHAAPKPGEVGHEEHKAYGKYFKKGDKVKDGSGNPHTVVSHSGPEVKTESGQTFHPTKLDRA